MSRGFSLYLDGVRAFAALVVLISHFAYTRFTDGDYVMVRECNLGSDAVIMFFVLSGFVIAFTVETRDHTWKRFAFNRASRLYSVAVRPVVLTLVFDALGSSLNPAAYDGWWYNKAPLVRTASVSALFANEWGAISLRLGTNGPYWSLSYEAAYYILFGFAVYLSGLCRPLLLAATTLLFGPKVVVLMLAWILGAVAYHYLLGGNRRPTGRLAPQCHAGRRAWIGGSLPRLPLRRCAQGAPDAIDRPAR